MVGRREPPALVLLVVALTQGARDGFRIMLRDRDRRRAALLSVSFHLLLLLAVLWWLRLPDPQPTPTYLVIDIGTPALAEEVVQAPTADLPAPQTPRPQVEDVEVGVPQAATVPRADPVTPEPAPQTVQPPAPEPTPVVPDPVAEAAPTAPPPEPAPVTPDPVVEAAPAPPVPAPSLPAAAADVPVRPLAATPLPEIVTPDLIPSPLAQRIEVPVPVVAAVVPEARAIAPTPSVTVSAPVPVPAPSVQTEVASSTTVPVPTVASQVVPSTSVPVPRVTSEVAPSTSVPVPSVASEVVPSTSVPVPAVVSDVAAARPVTVPDVRADLPAARAVGIQPQVAVAAPVQVPTPQLRAEVRGPEPSPEAPAVDMGAAATAATAAGSRDLQAPAGGDAARAGQTGPPSDVPDELGLGAAAGPDGSDQPTGSPAPPRTPFTQQLERPMAVVVDNVAGYPQHGIGFASQVHELPVEGGLTRLLQVYDRTDPERVGPVRSARDYMVDLSASMDAVMVHDGGSPGALAAIRATEALTLNAFTSGDLFSRGDGRAPYNLFAGGNALRQAVNRLAVGRGRTVTGVIYRPDEEQVDASEVRARFGGTYETGFRYEPGINAYRWIRNGSPASDASGQAVLVDAVLVASITARPIPGDAEGRLYIPLRGGEATLFVRGKAVTGEWSLRSGQGVQFTSAEGGVDLTPFRLWVVYTPNYEGVVVE